MERIKNILDKYLEGETTLAEERELQEFFATATEIPAEMKWAQAMFGTFCAEREEIISASSKIDVVALANPVTTKVRSLNSRRTIWFSAISVAAMVAVALTLTITLQTPNRTIYCYINGQTVTDRAIAERQAELISRIARSGEQIIEAGTEQIINALQSAKSVDKAMKYLNLIN